MTKTKSLTLLLASAALTGAIGLPAWSAMHAPSQDAALTPLTAVLGSGDEARPLMLVDDDDDDDDEGGSVSRSRSDDDDDDEGDCDDDEGSCGAMTGAPAPAGSMPPPQNGLFGTGTPQVQVK